MSTQETVNKYENLLSVIEEQVNTLSFELGEASVKRQEIQLKMEKEQEENASLLKKIAIKDKIIENESINLDIMQEKIASIKQEIEQHVVPLSEQTPKETKENPLEKQVSPPKKTVEPKKTASSPSKKAVQPKKSNKTLERIKALKERKNKT